MLCEIADSYFKTLNPLAERIGEDINRIKSAYENLWKELSLTEQEQIINETIIHPQVLLNYSLTIEDIYGKGGCLLSSGTKVITDEHTASSWRDEHSAPFSWKSRSQLELCTSPRCVPGLPPNQIKAVPLQPRKPSASLQFSALGDSTDGLITSAGASGAFINFCTRLKLLPGKSSGYQVTQSFDEKGFLSKFKNSAVCKIQNTLKSMGGKVSGPYNVEGDMRDMLVVGGAAVIVPRTEKVAGVVAKPTSPPPPPPRVQLRRDLAETPLLEPNTPVLHDKVPHQVTGSKHTSEEKMLSVKEDCSLPGDRVVVPKSGFDFLDDW